MYLEKRRRHQSVLHGALILMAAAGLARIIGMVFRLPLANMIGGVGMGYFTSAYDLFMPVYAVAMAGLPVAVSRMVAENVSRRRFKDARQILRISRRAFLITGLTGFFIMALAAYPYVVFTGNQNALVSILVIAPTLLFCCIMSTYRGYYEGMRNMYPTAVSSLIEAVCKMGLGLAFAQGILRYAASEFSASGTVFGQPVLSDGSGASLEELARHAALPYAAAGACAAITLGTALCAGFLL
ncbi:MAG TPA: polysaccharide biosynthesis protein, partial [Ruminococcaceae bacterium]|nr:polysaccharide biosynthesis protein [Oscillospiraceae bacterium]